MNVILNPVNHLDGRLQVPGDKSISHRAALLGGLAHGLTNIENFLQAADTDSTLQCLKALGVKVESQGERLAIHGQGPQALHAPHAPLFCGNSGTTMRFLMGILAGLPFAATLTGDDSLSKRPMDRMKTPLEAMGARITGVGARCTPPLGVAGCKLLAIEYHMPMASAQVKSGVLLAGLLAQGNTTVIEPAPARDHTERMLRAFGVEVQVAGARITVRGGSELHATDVQVPGDISSAAFFLVAAALRPGWQVTVRNVGVNPTRTGIIDVLRAMGAEVAIADIRSSGGEEFADVTVRGAALVPTRIAGALVPRLIDELPVLALLATQAEGSTVIADAAEMRVKESDRIAVIAKELRKLGAHIDEQPDGMIIHGPTPLRGAPVISPRGDHRIAMTLAIASLIATGPTEISNAEAITSSFPNFLDLLQQVSSH